MQHVSDVYVQTRLAYKFVHFSTTQFRTVQLQLARQIRITIGSVEEAQASWIGKLQLLRTQKKAVTADQYRSVSQEVIAKMTAVKKEAADAAKSAATVRLLHTHIYTCLFSIIL